MFDPGADVPELIEDIRRLYWRGVHSAGGLPTKRLDADNVGGSKPGTRPPSYGPLHNHEELEDAVADIRALLLGIRRMCWSRLIEPLPDDRPETQADARVEQLHRVKAGYPGWTAEQVAVAENLSLREVQEQRKKARAA